MEANQNQREEKLLHAVREAEENHGIYGFVLSLMMSSFYYALDTPCRKDAAPDISVKKCFAYEDQLNLN